MTRNEIIRMAQEIWGKSEWNDAQSERLGRFAALVAAAEREACATVAWNHFMDVCIKNGRAPAMWDEWCAARAIRKQALGPASGCVPGAGNCLAGE